MLPPHWPHRIIIARTFALLCPLQKSNMGLKCIQYIRKGVEFLKTIMRGVLPLLLIFALLCGTVSASGTFSDVSSGAYYYDAVQWAVENGITTGTSASKFGPGDSCTRAQIVTFLYRAMGGTLPDGENPFGDIRSGDYFYAPVLWAVGENITQGVSSSSFSPASHCTRAQAVTFLWRAAGSPEAESSAGFSDVAEGQFYTEAVSWAVEEGITAGTSATKFSPADSCTRAQIVTFLYRFCCGVEAEPEPEPEPDVDSSFWKSRFPVPTQAQINAYTNPDYLRSPYIAGWMDTGNDTRFTEYSVDFKADYAPEGTYCCLANHKLDLSPLEAKYSSVRTEYASVHTYSGFQNTVTDKGKVSILSFWDIYVTDAYGRETVIRPTLVYPEPDGDDDFGGEGTGAHRIVPYDWQESRWYRMLLQCGKSPTTGNTTVEQWVCELDTGKWTKLCVYDLGFAGSCFEGDVAFFLENYISSLAGEVRTMEVKNPRIRLQSNGQWVNINSAYMSSQGGKPKYEGSYAFGVSGDSFWAITSGVGGDWYNNGKGRSGAWLSITNTATGSPY